MKALQNLVEYYDELFPFSGAQKKFYASFSETYPNPVKFLRVSCGTGLFETVLSREGHDVTGTDTCEEFLASANLRKRSQLMSIRFFQMSFSDLTKFLGKGFYNVVSILDSRLMFAKSREEILDFFKSVKLLLAPGGTFVIQMLNFEKFEGPQMVQLPVLESVRAKLFSELSFGGQEGCTLSLHLENGMGKILPVMVKVPVCPLVPSEIEEFAEAAGFSSAEFYADFEKNPFTGNEDSYIVIIR